MQNCGNLSLECSAGLELLYEWRAIAYIVAHYVITQQRESFRPTLVSLVQAMRYARLPRVFIFSIHDLKYNNNSAQRCTTYWSSFSMNIHNMMLTEHLMRWVHRERL